MVEVELKDLMTFFRAVSILNPILDECSSTEELRDLALLLVCLWLCRHPDTLIESLEALRDKMPRLLESVQGFLAAAHEISIKA